MAQEPLPFDIRSFEVIARTPMLRVVELELGASEEVPWHFHTQITDTFYCLLGEARIQHGARGEDARLRVGESHSVPVGTPHRVSNGGTSPCRLLLVQGVGAYDFVPTAP